jgi:antitoxin FitA
MRSMASITIDISDSQMQRLQNLAQQHGISPEALLYSSLENLLNQPDPEFANAADYVLSKNAELYRRLA